MSIIREHVVKRFTRSNGWRKLRNWQIERFPECAVCGRKRGLEAHHIQAFKDCPELELEAGNLATMCRRCHLLIGHLGSWKCVNGEFWKVVKRLSMLIRSRK